MKKYMNATIGWVLAAVIVIGGAVYAIQHNSSTSDSMMKDDSAMTDTKSADTMMASSSDSMKKDESGDSMMMDASTTMKTDVMVK